MAGSLQGAARCVLWPLIRALRQRLRRVQDLFSEYYAAVSLAPYDGSSSIIFSTTCLHQLELEKAGQPFARAASLTACDVDRVVTTGPRLRGYRLDG